MRTCQAVQFPESGRGSDESAQTWKGRYRQARRAARRFLNSRTKHWLILTLIILDVAGILSDIFIALITCELGIRHEKWVAPTRASLTEFSLVLSCLFLVELGLSLWAEGLR